MSRKQRGELMFSVTMADCDLETFAAGGPGGQHQNTSNTAVRITHRASGACGEARDSRSQHQNKLAAWKRMTSSGKFTVWLNKQIALQGKDPAAEVRKEMAPHNLLIEAYHDGAWELIA